MNEAHTETVIIPHPNEQKTLADLQKQVLREVQERAGSRELWIPTFPLYVRGNKEFLTEDTERTEKFAEELLAVWGGRITGCTLTELRVSDDGKRIFLTTEIATQTAADAQTKTIAGTLTLAERLRVNGENAGNSGLSDEDTGNTSVSIGLDPIHSCALPLRLPVFRVARVEFVHVGTRTEWTVRESAWVKRR